MSAAPQHLILIPGTLNDAELWRDQVEGLAGIATIHVADITQGNSLRELAEDILASAPETFALAGFSLGGYVAQEIVRLAPDRVERLALLDTSIRGESPIRAKSRKALAGSAQAAGKFHGFGDRLLVDYLDPAHLHDEAIVGRIRAMTERLGAEVFLRQNAIERTDGADALAGFAGPVLILCGENDRLTPLADHRDMAGLAENGRLVIVPHAGHMTPIENPAAVTEALKDWLARD